MKDEMIVAVKKLFEKLAPKKEEEVDEGMLSRLQQIEERASSRESGETSGRHGAVAEPTGEISGRFGSVKAAQDRDSDTGASGMAHWSANPDKYIKQQMRAIEGLAGGHKGFDIDPMKRR